jgi:hypothetical protein
MKILAEIAAPLAKIKLESSQTQRNALALHNPNTDSIIKKPNQRKE